MINLLGDWWGTSDDNKPSEAKYPNLGRLDHEAVIYEMKLEIRHTKQHDMKSAWRYVKQYKIFSSHFWDVCT